MALPQQETLIASTTSSTVNSGVVNLTAIANRWAVFWTLSAPSSPTFNFTASTDNVNFAPVTPAAFRGQWAVFDTPAQYVTCNMANNSVTAAVFAVGMSD